MIDLKTKLFFWFKGPQVAKLADALTELGTEWETWLKSPLTEADVSACSPEALRAHAVSRGLPRLPGETDALWRRRVRHAYTVAFESGTLRGLEAILTAYGVVAFSIQERVPGEDWDKIFITIEPGGLVGASTVVLAALFNQWGRACRRYIVATYETAPIYAAALRVEEIQMQDIAA